MKEEHATWRRYSLFSALPKKKKKKQGKENQLFFQLESMPWFCSSPELLNGLLFQFTFLYTLRILLIDGPFY